MLRPGGIARRIAVRAGVVAVSAVLLLAQGGRGAGKAEGAGPCERACLEGFVNEYLEALVAHNAFGLPLASKVKFTENGLPLELGDGLWNVTTGIGPYKIYVADPQSQQVAFIGTLLENNRPVTLALRLKLDDRKITEIETMVHRADGGPPPGANAKGPSAALVGAEALNAMGGPDPLLVRAEPAGERVSRDRLIAAANSYFDAIERSDGSVGMFAPECDRLENGVKVTNNPKARAGRGEGVNTGPMGCAEQISSKAFSNYQVIYPRRFPVVDEERQLVFGTFTYQQPGDILRVQPPGERPVNLPDSATQPAFLEVVQLFKMTGGKIRKMEALTLTVPYGEPDPFFGDDWRRGK